MRFVKKDMKRRALEVSLLVLSGVVWYNLTVMIVSPRKWSPSDDHQQIDPVMPMPEKMKKARNQRRPFHVAMTAEDSPYSKWQSRIMYYWYSKKKMELPRSEMGKFTRILHSGSPDNLMDEIPTFLVDPLPPGFDRVRS